MTAWLNRRVAVPNWVFVVVWLVVFFRILP